MRTHLSAACLLACASLGVAAGCSGEATPTRPSTVMNMHDDPLSGPSVSPDVRQHIAKLKAWSAPFHDLDKAAAAHYDVLFANKCIDETTVGVPRTADPPPRGMGYHMTRSDVDLVSDGTLDEDTPEFLVYAPSIHDADLPAAERLKASRLVGFEYFLPGPRRNPAPTLFNVELGYSDAFGGYVLHLYIWGHNPQGLTENFNTKVPLCADPLVL